METLPIVSPHELSVSAQAAGAMAEIQSAYVMAMQKPRDVDKARKRLLENCKRERFAAVARYSRKVGYDYEKKKDVYAEGWSIRTAEVGHTCWGNILLRSAILVDNDELCKISVTGIDLETNSIQTMEGTVKKIVERKKPGKREILYERENSSGEVIYGLRAFDHEVDTAAAALRAKLKRDCLLALIPRDILDEMLDAVNETLTGGDKADPIATRKKILDSFDDHGISSKQLVAIVGKETSEWGPKDFAHLRKIYAAVSTGEANIDQFMPIDVKPEPQRATIDISEIKPVQHEDNPQGLTITAEQVWDSFVADKTENWGVEHDTWKKVWKEAMRVFGLKSKELVPDSRAKEFDDWLNSPSDGATGLLLSWGFGSREPGDD